jgi:ATP-binding cassette subfamily C exporter for protease/lipase
VVLISHRTSIISAVDKLLVLRDGMIQAFGPRDQVVQSLQQAAQQAAPKAVGQPQPAA